MKYGNIKLVRFGKLALIVFLFFNFVFAQELPVGEEKIYVCPLATKIEEINPRCDCRIDLILGETVTSTCSKNNQTYEMTLTITEYEGKEYYAIYGFENGGAGMNLTPEAKISGNFEGKVGESLNFSAFNSSDPNGDPLNFYWDFGDGNFAKGRDVDHAYSLAGNYLLLLVVEDGLTSSSATATVTIFSSLSSSGLGITPFRVEKAKEKKEEKEKVEKKEIDKKTKFLAPPSSKISFKIPVEKEIEEKEIEKEIASQKIEKETKKPIQKETFLANLVEIVKEKIPIHSVIFIFLIVAIFEILKIKNYFWQKKKL